MTTLAISGHRGLPTETTNLVDQALRAALVQHTPLVGISCLADGADQLFAQAVVDAGGDLIVIVPAAEYRQDLPAECHPSYDRLLAKASKVVRLNHTHSDTQAHMDAGAAMLDLSEHLLAVWDGKPARGYGGTADVVKLAQTRGIPVTVIWPNGATRD